MTNQIAPYEVDKSLIIPYTKGLSTAEGGRGHVTT